MSCSVNHRPTIFSGWSRLYLNSFLCDKKNLLNSCIDQSLMFSPCCLLIQIYLYCTDKLSEPSLAFITHFPEHTDCSVRVDFQTLLCRCIILTDLNIMIVHNPLAKPEYCLKLKQNFQIQVHFKVCYIQSGTIFSFRCEINVRLQLLKWIENI